MLVSMHSAMILNKGDNSLRCCFVGPYLTLTKGLPLGLACSSVTTPEQSWLCFALPAASTSSGEIETRLGGAGGLAAGLPGNLHDVVSRA